MTEWRRKFKNGQKDIHVNDDSTILISTSRTDAKAAQVKELEN
jgi:hypothetical protein